MMARKLGYGNPKETLTTSTGYPRIPPSRLRRKNDIRRGCWNGKSRRGELHDMAAIAKAGRRSCDACLAGSTWIFCIGG